MLPNLENVGKSNVKISRKLRIKNFNFLKININLIKYNLKLVTLIDSNEFHKKKYWFAKNLLLIYY